MGYKNSPSYVQRQIDRLLREHRTFSKAYVDDVRMWYLRSWTYWSKWPSVDITELIQVHAGPMSNYSASSKAQHIRGQRLPRTTSGNPWTSFYSEQLLALRNEFGYQGLSTISPHAPTKERDDDPQLRDGPQQLRFYGITYCRRGPDFSHLINHKPTNLNKSRSEPHERPRNRKALRGKFLAKDHLSWSEGIVQKMWA